jgi:hypothetical protein
MHGHVSNIVKSGYRAMNPASLLIFSLDCSALILKAGALSAP